MTDVSEASALLKQYAGPRRDGEDVKAVIARVARGLEWSFWRTFDVWYEKARRVKDDEVLKIRAALKSKSEKDVIHELHELRVRLARLEAMLSERD